MTEQRIPKFESEEEEAKWWFDHREETSQWMEDALRDGATLKLVDVLKKRVGTGATPTVSIRIDPSDIARARTLADTFGFRFSSGIECGGAKCLNSSAFLARRSAGVSVVGV